MHLAILGLVLFLAPADPPATGEGDLAAARRELQSIRDADVVVLARVETVHRGPEIWCGLIATRQDVTWRVEEVISSSLPAAEGPDGGPTPGELLRVGHLLTGRLLHRDHPSLRPDLVHAGARAILLLHRGEGGWLVQDESLGVRLLDPPLEPAPDRRALLSALLDLPALAPYLHPEIPSRKPVRFALSAALPRPVPALRTFDQPVLFLAKAELEHDPHLEVETLAVEGDVARITFRYDVEGVVGEVRFERRDAGWQAVEAEVSER